MWRGFLTIGSALRGSRRTLGGGVFHCIDP
jgi:hypothetical protein